MSSSGLKNSQVPILAEAVIFEILSRLPAKSIARFRCVSKQWAYDLRLPYFTDLYFTRSCARPQLLFVCQKHGQVFFFISRQPQNIDHENSKGSSLLLTATHQMKTTYGFSSRSSRFTKGLVFLSYHRVLERDHEWDLVPVLCNPSTGQYMSLPDAADSWRSDIKRCSFLGYDPVEKQYKVLMAMNDQIQEEYQVLTLGNIREPSWRRIQCCVSHYFREARNQICINGVVYYRAVDNSSKGFVIVCFDVRSEKFRFVKDTDSFTSSYRCATLINYNGKLASIGSQRRRGISSMCTSIKFRVLEDADKHQWSERIYVLPALWKNIVGGSGTILNFVGVTRTNEVVLSSSSVQAAPFYVFYYSTERKTATRVEIQGLEFFMSQNVSIYFDYVEDVKLL